LKATELEVRSNGGRDPVEVDLSIECGLAMEMSKSIQRKKQKGRSSYMTAVLTLTSDLDLIDFRRIPYVFSAGSSSHTDRQLYSTKSLQSLRTYEATAILSKPSQSVVISIASVMSSSLLNKM
jgi:ATP-dependent DNA helicase HFM1/MER3